MLAAFVGVAGFGLLALKNNPNTGVLGDVALTLQTINKVNDGGTITSSPAGINCGSDCSEIYTEGQEVVLTVTPDAGRKFEFWSIGNNCSEASNTTTTCTVTVPAGGLTMNAYWAYTNYSFTVQKTGDGSGTVTGSSAGVNCGSDCSGSSAYNTNFTLTATPSSGSEFIGWQTSGTFCYSSEGGGKAGGGTKIVNPSQTCTTKFYGYENPGYVAIAKFNSTGEESSESVSDDTSSDTGSTTGTGGTETGGDESDKSDELTAKLLDDDGKEIKTDGDELTVFDEGKSITVSGTTVPKEKVKLYIFSDPKEATVTADDDGIWSYVITGLEPGEHRVEAEVTDPVSGETTKREQVLSFEVAQAVSEQPLTETALTGEETDDTYEADSNIISYLAGGVAALAAIAGAAFWWWRKRQSQKPLASKTIQPGSSPSSSSVKDKTS